MMDSDQVHFHMEGERDRWIEETEEELIDKEPCTKRR